MNTASEYFLESACKAVPPAKSERAAIKNEAEKLGRNLARKDIADKKTLRKTAEKLLETLGLPKKYTGFAMVYLGNAVFGNHFYALPYEKRLLLLPHCLRNKDQCRGDYDHIQLKCANCGSCFLENIKNEAEKLGYTILIAEGTPVVVRILAETDIEGILGAACLDSMEKSFEKIRKGGIAAVGIPLLGNNCVNTKLDEEEILGCLRKISTKPDQKKEQPLDALAETVFQSVMRHYPEPAVEVEKIARDFVLRGGKRYRPFLAVAAYSLLSNAGQIPEHVYKAALSIELFHKASLIHDDIEDHSDYRYNHPALHTRHGIPTAINTGDYLVGLGYHIIMEASFKTEIREHILKMLFRVHKNLALGQGIELLWRKSPISVITAEKALDCYEKKSAEAFRGSFLTGALLAEADHNTIDLLDRFASHFGKAFQLDDDLKDFQTAIKTAHLSGENINTCDLFIPIIIALTVTGLDPENKRKMELIYGKKVLKRSDIDFVALCAEKTGAIKQVITQKEKEIDFCEQMLSGSVSKPLAGFLRKFLNRAFL